MNRKDQITRRGFLELSSAVVATAGLPDVNASKAGPDLGKNADALKADSVLMTGKIALEEHFLLPETAEPDSSLGYALFHAGIAAPAERHGQRTDR